MQSRFQLKGSSPRARGTRRRLHPRVQHVGIIPACAGNTLIQVALNLIDVPVARSSAVRRATIEIDRHNVDRVLIITNGWIIDDLRKNKP
nr:MAG TPA: hypothetical protein [Caudoviricetes sp.]